MLVFYSLKTMKTNHLFTAFLAFLLPIASLVCKEHRLVDASNLRKKTKVISDKLKGSDLTEIMTCIYKASKGKNGYSF